MTEHSHPVGRGCTVGCPAHGMPPTPPPPPPTGTGSPSRETGPNPEQNWLRGSWMQTFTGRQFFPLDARAEEIDARDIAHALSLICRYGGHTKRFYSVAEHCWLMSYAVPREHALWALLHDATEAYVGDMVRPLKHHMPEYRAIEDRLMAVIAERFNLSSATMPAAVKDADNRILLDERAVLLSTPPEAWQQDGLEPLGVRIEALSPSRIERLYQWRLDELLARVPSPTEGRA